jgi:hypothetical protein
MDIMPGLAFYLLKLDEKENKMEVNDILAQKLDLFRKIKDVATELEKDLSEGKWDAFQDLQRKRDRLQRDVSRKDRDLARFRRKGMKVSLDQKSRRITGEIIDLIQMIQAIDEKINKQVLKERENIFKEIKNVRQGQKAMRGYGRRAGGDPKFINWRG